MQCDVRQSNEDEIIPLFKTMVIGNKPSDISWHDGHLSLKYNKGKQEIRYWLRPSGYVTFEFYTGVHNIRFDGDLKDEVCINILRLDSKEGKGTKLSDFINLKDE